jgi:hypothetical protein
MRNDPPYTLSPLATLSEPLPSLELEQDVANTASERIKNQDFFITGNDI